MIDRMKLVVLASVVVMAASGAVDVTRAEDIAMKGAGLDIAKPEPEHEEMVAVDPVIEEFPVTYLSELVPLDENEQFCLNTWCEQYGVPYTLALAMIQAESSFNQNAVNKAGTCFSYMQINACNEAWLKKDLGISSVKNPLDNLRSGVYMIGGYIRKYEDLSMALMAYNLGTGGAKSKFAQGIYETAYTRKILGLKAEWDKVLGKVDY